jgi:hypothetical protein
MTSKDRFKTGRNLSRQALRPEARLEMAKEPTASEGILSRGVIGYVGKRLQSSPRAFFRCS